LGRIDSETRCAFWPEEPVDHDFDPTRLIEVDFSRTPSAAAAKEITWDAVQVDDCLTGPTGAVSGTTLGPRWPELQLAGAVYLERGFVASLPAGLRPACPPLGMNGQSYECMTAVYHNPRTTDKQQVTNPRSHHEKGSRSSRVRHTDRPTRATGRRRAATPASGRRAVQHHRAAGHYRADHRDRYQASAV
jgi:hypothetical protein